MSSIGRSSLKHCTIVTYDYFGEKLIFNLKAINAMRRVPQSFCEVEASGKKGKLFTRSKELLAIRAWFSVDNKVGTGFPHTAT